MQTQVRTKDKNFQNQMDMMAASDAGFKSVDAYKTYLDTLKPHWFVNYNLEITLLLFHN